MQADLLAGEEIATCPSCSLIIKVIYDLVNMNIYSICVWIALFIFL